MAEDLFGIDVDAVTRQAVISDCGRYRYSLRRCWNPERPTVYWIMLNPSTASALTDDATVRRCVGFAKSWKAGAIVIRNLFAWRSRSPALLWKATEPVGPENDDWIRDLAQTPGQLVVAWGAFSNPRKGERVAEVLRILGDRQLLCLGTTDAGQPRHPLFVRADAKLVPWAPPEANR